MKSFKTAVAFLAVAAASGAAPPLKLPEALAGYREWGTLLKEPIMVPYELSVLCRAATASELAAAKKRHGPHDKYLIDVFANPAARAVLEDDAVKTKTLPAGSVIAKEKIRWVKPGETVLDGVAFMVKREGAQFRESGGWEFLFFPAGDAKKTQAGCAGCHKGAADRDYVFGSYAPQS
jgi:hypothetical protein